MPTLGELAAIADCEVAGDPVLPVLGVADPSRAGPGDMVFLVDPRFRDLVAQCRAGFVLAAGPVGDRPGLIAGNPRLAMARVMAVFARHCAISGIDPTARIDPSARIDPDVAVGPGVIVAAGASVGQGTVLHARVVLYPGVRIGRDCLLHAGVVIREDCLLGDRVVVQPGAVVGSDGFGFVPSPEGNVKIPQLGVVIVEDDVEIGANCAIDRGTLGDTVIRRGTKLDNLVHLAHNVEVGAHSLLVAQVGISGSTRLGERCVFGGQSGAVGHLEIGPRVTVAAKAGVTRDTPADQVLSGFPARPHRAELRRRAELARLAGRVARLEARLAELERQDGGGIEAERGARG